jgi:hypothetical protein
MNIRVKIFLAMGAVVLGCGMAVVSSEQRDWSFIQSVGGLGVDEPQKLDNGNYRLPVRCDVSGLHAITVKPTTLNSGLIVRETRATVREHTVQIWIVTCVADKHHNARAPDVILKNLPPGTYQVQYRSRDGSLTRLREIEIR